MTETAYKVQREKLTKLIISAKQEKDEKAIAEIIMGCIDILSAEIANKIHCQEIYKIDEQQ